MNTLRWRHTKRTGNARGVRLSWSSDDVCHGGDCDGGDGGCLDYSDGDCSDGVGGCHIVECEGEGVPQGSAIVIVKVMMRIVVI